MISGGLINIIIAYGLFVVVVETKSSAPGGPPGWYRQSPPQLGRAHDFTWKCRWS